MKINFKIITLLFFLTNIEVTAQKVYYTNFKNDADLTVYITDKKSNADIIVKKVKYNDEVKRGFWKEVKLKTDADIVVYVTHKNTRDVKKVYFTKFNDEVKF